MKRFYAGVMHPQIAIWLWPILSMGLLLVLAVFYNRAFCGGPLLDMKGYLIPAIYGSTLGLASAAWYRRSMFLFRESQERGLGYKKLNRRYELILQGTNEGIYEIDCYGKCLFINHAALKILGYQEVEILGKNIHDLIHNHERWGESYMNSPCLFLEVIKKRSEASFYDEIMIRKDGTRLIAEIRAYPVFDKEGDFIVVIFHDATNEKQLQQRIHHMANFDELTGLVSRSSFEKNLQSMIRDAHENNKSHALLYIDIDQFKIVNDIAGHVAGDILLQKFSSHLIKFIRQADVLGRLGGDEFGLILNNLKLEDLYLYITKLQEHVGSFLFEWDEDSFKVGLSIGICLLDKQILNATQALKRADQACCLSKESGRNQYLVFNSDDPDFCTMNKHMGWVAQINKALNENRFFLRRQSIERLSNRKKNLDRFEILLSMRDHTGEVLPPGNFLPAAERYNLMPLIDSMVVQKSFEWMDDNSEKIESLDFLSINLSGDSISDENFRQYLQSELEKRHTIAHKICFEITETVAIQKMHKVVEFLRNMRRLGCRFALDDFGSGMASFAYLKYLPVNFVKIDGSFIRDIKNNPLSREIVESMHRIARVMRISTIAEHAEDEETVAILRQIGIDFVQGYVIDKPSPLSETFHVE
ncbi:EAL domain-containing protein [uncultured Desulfuromusa sp.]|uniref:EAL domain-containing protein n=1 Tax=uncultured Desulfuromusa sp. TaxID=219183 RepID=UPI002AA8CB88|nr:EAL domain-containing protein [uncultured Desulfuromusa sp.]